MPTIQDANANANNLARSETVIPPGPYCYGTSICPYWAMDPSRPSQENGYCAFLRSGDWEDGGPSLLWDQVKECGVNSDEEGDHATYNDPDHVQASIDSGASDPAASKPPVIRFPQSNAEARRLLSLALTADTVRAREKALASIAAGQDAGRDYGSDVTDLVKKVEGARP